MEPHEDNVVPGQQNAPQEGKLTYTSDPLSATEVNEGARQHDQLDKLKQNEHKIDDADDIKAEPDVYEYKRQNKSEEDE